MQQQAETSEGLKHFAEQEALIEKLIDLKLSIEICGSWIWVSGDTKPHASVLKQMGFWWAPKKKCWYLKPAGIHRGRNCAPWDMDKIRTTHGSLNPLLE